MKVKIQYEGEFWHVIVEKNGVDCFVDMDYVLQNQTIFELAKAIGNIQLPSKWSGDQWHYKQTETVKSPRVFFTNKVFCAAFAAALDVYMNCNTTEEIKLIEKV